ncbi:MAG: alpha-ribazole phosphatase family protein [Halorhodospira halophila]|uniref:histidine phosphatase family protein n=1 Tax=Halorhodospira TaxID=85108 RepID=UPI001912BBF8|nr:alpha-ribazole phosphatase family protein [Halorhodospira halophila]MCG5532705.1 alpha-ribazole phosphatase family protein [Halorhodospira sp. 9621]MCG5537751.1 alpha-ribazole phosphatase family protein [Halorhodospira sp. 9622]MCG5539900.1 alpha-ribazole phosphatase family protein [Halorhodospira sp. M39old]MCG5542421.1 alpha-ribazole phosphatase family protein [Halorhodospira sp. 9628]MCG5545264.1 alpha-ribazole phosphatase family protein [Halorhodospira sp. M38]
MRPPIEGQETWIDLIRHGEPVGGRRYRGTQDDPLSERGWAQMRAAPLEPAALTRIVCSPLRRCREFSERYAAEQGLPLQVENGFQEIGFGDWEGLTPAELYEQDPQGQARFWADPLHYTPPNAEPMADFQRRVIDAWVRLLAEHPGEHLLLVGHGGLIRVVLSHLLELPLRGFNRLYVPYASVSRVRVEPGTDPTLYFHNRATSAEGER